MSLYNRLVIGGSIITDLSKIGEGKHGVTQFTLRNENNAGRYYEFLVSAQRSLLDGYMVGSLVEVSGELREYYMRVKSIVDGVSTEVPKIVSYINAEDIYSPVVGTEFVNDFVIKGDVIRVRNPRTSYANTNENVCDFTVKVLASNNRFSYIQCSAWKEHCEKARSLIIGETIDVRGRLSCRFNKFGERTTTLMVHGLDRTLEV